MSDSNQGNNQQNYQQYSQNGNQQQGNNRYQGYQAYNAQAQPAGGYYQNYQGYSGYQQGGYQQYNPDAGYQQQYNPQGGYQQYNPQGGYQQQFNPQGGRGNYKNFNYNNNLQGYQAGFQPQSQAQIAIVELKSIIAAGFSCVMHVHTAIEEVHIVKLLHKLEKGTNRKSKKPPAFAKKGMKVIAVLETEAPVCVETYQDYPQLGRFTLRDQGTTIAIGKIVKIAE
uniref:SUP35 protein n=1 Tax=Saccharomyces cerevisiae TaxID=4932 RepID=E9P9V7_YEASX|nr:omnipotent suppressor [Saccharomyces cerevisiae]